MSVRKIKNSWWVDLRVDYTRYRKRSPENTKVGAEAYEVVLRQKLARGESIGKVVHTADQIQLFGQFAWKWFDDYVVPNNKYQEQRMKMYILRSALVPFFGKMRIEQIATHHIEQYKAYALKRGVKAKTINNRLAVLGKCIRTAYEWLEIKGIPPKIVLLKCPPPQTNYLSVGESMLLLSNADALIGEVILLALRTGMRQGELRGLQWSSINWQNQTITVRHSLNDRTKKLESPKSNRERHIPMSVDVYQMLFKRKSEGGFVFIDSNSLPYDSQRLIKRLNEVRKRAGLRKFTWHSLRHTFATLLATKGAPLHVVQALLGHSNISTTMRYAHVAPSTLRSAIDMLDPKSAFKANYGQPVGNQWSETIEQEIE